MSVDFAVPASSVSSEPASLTVTRTDHHCDAPGRVRCCSAPLLTDTAPVPALVEAPLDTDTPPVLPSSSSPDADSIRTSPLVLPMPPAPEDRVSDPPLTAEAGSREETGGFLGLFPTDGSMCTGRPWPHIVNGERFQKAGCGVPAAFIKTFINKLLFPIVNRPFPLGLR